jgi:hypothetical protein
MCGAKADDKGRKMMVAVTAYAVVWLILTVYVAGVTRVERRMRQRGGAVHKGSDADA